MQELISAKKVAVQSFTNLALIWMDVDTILFLRIIEIEVTIPLFQICCTTEDKFTKFALEYNKVRPSIRELNLTHKYDLK